MSMRQQEEPDTAKQEEVQELLDALAEARAVLHSHPDEKEALQIQEDIKDALVALGVGDAALAQDSTNAASEAPSGTAVCSPFTSCDPTPAATEGPNRPLDRNHTPASSASNLALAQRPARARQMAHPSNQYITTRPDFAVLAEKYPSFRPFVAIKNGRGSIDFKSWHASRELTRVLLLEDFGLLDWSLPEGHLVPAIPNRLNYIHWINDLLQLSSVHGDKTPVHGLDIGCGANLIYPLLGASMYGWRFTAVDTDAAGIAAAGHNLSLNPHLQPLINLRVPAHAELSASTSLAARACKATGSSSSPNKRSMDHVGAVAVDPRHAAEHQESDSASAAQRQANRSSASPAPSPEKCDTHDAPSTESAGRNRQEGHGQGTVGPSPLRVLQGVVSPGERFDFCMCNPPFFERAEEAYQNPDTAYGGTAAEMACEGGEDHFVKTMIQESLELRGSVHWYTSMLGKKRTFKALRALLNRLPVTAVRSRELVQGRTIRWAVAWSFTVPKSLATQPVGAYPDVTSAAKRRRL